MPTVTNDRLRVEIDTKGCEIPADVRNRIQPNLDGLELSLHGLPTSQLWLTVVFHSHSETFHAQAKLRLPGQTIITGDRNSHIDSAILQCLRNVLQRVESYKSHPDRSAIEDAERQEELANNVIAPVESDAGKFGDAYRTADYEAFRKAISDYERPLRMRVGRWIQRYPQLQANVGVTFEISDLLEELFLTAFDQYGHRPKQLSLYEWLVNLIDPAVKSFWHKSEDREAVSYAQTLTELGKPGSSGS